MVSSPYNPFVSTVQRSSDTTPVVLLGDEFGNAPKYLTGDFTADVLDNVLVSNEHELSDGDLVQLRTTNEMAGGLSIGRVYNVRDASLNSFKVSETPGGAAVTITDEGDGRHFWAKQGDLTSSLRPRAIRLSSGGRVLDHVDLEYDLAAVGERLSNTQTPTRYARQVEVRLLDVDGLPTIPLAWGDITEQTIGLGASTSDERVRVRVTVQPNHFGNPLVGYTVWDPISESEKTIHRDPVFNPEIAGDIVGNLHEKTDGTTAPARLFVDPQASRSTSSRQYHDTTPQTWDLEEAVRWICLTCNPGELFVGNPDLEGVNWLGAPQLKNVTLRRGLYLPDYLDALLAPHGYDWCLEYAVSEDGSSSRTIRVFRIGEGVEKQFHWLAPGGQFTGTLDQDTERFDLTTNVGDVANVIEGYGAAEQREVTLELFRAWSEDDDGETNDDNLAANPDIWRKWTANLGGDYAYDPADGTTRLRETTRPIPVAPPDLSSVFTTWVPRERAFVRPLTFEKNDELSDRRSGLYVEWSDDDGTTWYDIAHPEDGLGIGYRVPHDEAAIFFTQIPALLQSAGDNARLRVTCTLTGDARLTDTISSTDTSPNLREVKLVLDLGDRFADRSVKTGGDTWSGHNGSGVQSNFGSTLYEDVGAADEVDDSTELNEFLTRVQANEESAGMRGTFDLIGLIAGYRIGDLITGISGRDIDFNRNSPDAETQKYLQVTGLDWDIEGRRTRVVVTPYEEPVQ